MPELRSGICFWGWCLAVALPGLAAGTTAPSDIDFNRDIRPILSEQCFSCHGPDPGQRQASLRLDTAEGIVSEREGKGPAVVPGSARQSPLYRRISSPDPASRMPPGFLGHEPLSDLQIRQVESWIDQGARWQPHWAFLPVRRPDTPLVRNRGWVRNGLDAFVLHRLEENGLAPSPQAAPETLIRRVTLDLTGLPPSPQDLDRFLRDPSPDAYEKLVDRLLGSTRYGEHMAVRWLEAARYADTNGYQSDGIRQMWSWRDWVIGAFNRNLGFHQFTIEQLAGDLLAGATRDQIVATGFNRNHRTSAEGGSIDEELRVEYVADRVETTSTVWMGLTVGCARCHDHKYDPISQREYYRFYSFFNNVPERGFVYNYGNEDPVIKAPTPSQEARLDELDAQVRKARLRLEELDDERSRAQRAWEEEVREQGGSEDWTLDRGLLVHFPLDGDWSETTGNLKRVWAEEAEKKKEKQKEQAKEKAVEPEESLPEPPFLDGGPEPKLDFAPGRKGQAGRFDGRFVNGGPVASFDYMDPFTLSAWFYPRSGQGAILSSVVDRFRGRGYGLYLREGKLRFNFTYRWSDLGMRLETEQVLERNRWHHVVLSYDGRRNASGFRLHLNGVLQEPVVLFDYLLQPMGPKRDFRIGAGEGPDDRFDGFIDEVRIYDRELSNREARVIGLLDPVSELAALAPSDRRVTQQDKLDLCFLEGGHAPEAVRQAVQELREAQERRQDHYASIPTVMVMKERSERRQTYVLDRGAYDAHTEPVKPGVPAALDSKFEAPVPDRLGLARWLVDRSNPLTARVTVNRLWQKLFGAGLVRTPEDFGSQGDRPTHPRLLDWLAAEFMKSGWDVKGLLRTVVTSATYRQSSRQSPELSERDPENLLLARAPRFRLPAQAIRDQALAVSGLLVEQLGGPSVKPYQPPGLWKELTSRKGGYEADQGESLYRRSLYTFWRRTIAPPAMVTFDASTREACTVRTDRTNTPLQALNLMNDETYLETSRRLAERMLEEGGATPLARIAYGFRLVTARWPGPSEQTTLLQALERFEQDFETRPQEALDYLASGASARNENLNPQELASYAGLASVILNLDEAITKE